MKKIIVTCFSLFVLFTSFAQQQFIVKGKIEFERKINLHKQLEENSFSEMMRKSMPQYKTDYFDLYFLGDKTLYKPGKEVVQQKIPEWFNGPASDNVVFNDVHEGKFSSQKAVFENTFLVQDSLRKINWKLTADTRTIAGFECRKATAIIMDTVFVVAFYTDQIVTPGGPESFTGLPGMILGLAIPRMNITWFATKLELIEVKDVDAMAPKKGKKTNIADLNNQLKSSMKDWGKQGQKFIWRIMI
jgi:GLPGLI family protein